MHCVINLAQAYRHFAMRWRVIKKRFLTLHFRYLYTDNAPYAIAAYVDVDIAVVAAKRLAVIATCHARVAAQ